MLSFISLGMGSVTLGSVLFASCLLIAVCLILFHSSHDMMDCGFFNLFSRMSLSRLSFWLMYGLGIVIQLSLA
ncbi:uncharacterized protein BDV14DRAFT_6641 [Aspergillus stella-maris]|uniref:uncharacterized protein n=1 Tax=Aspergillus stella-maris TaxID=1810926 RepID=UPI003CCE2D7B